MTEIMNGFITADVMPRAHALAASWKARVDDLNGREGAELADAVQALSDQMTANIEAIAWIEHAVNLRAGKTITA